MNSISGKRVFVTGGAKGIGRAVVQMFTEEGNNVAFCDMDGESGRELAVHSGLRFFNIDVRDASLLEGAMHELFELWGDIDIIVNNVGVSRFVPITETSVEEFDDVLATNLRPVFVTSRALALHRKNHCPEPHYGRIVNLASTRWLMSEEGTEAYSASKGGIYSLTHALAMSLSVYGITVNSIAPGWIENYAYDTLREEDHLQHPSRRVGRPEDIARTALFLCSEANDFINGQNITVDGGMTKKMIYVP